MRGGIAIARLVGVLLLVAQGVALAEPSQDGSCPAPMSSAESVGRLLDSVSSLLGAISRSLPPPPKSELDLARERVAALEQESRRNAHLLQETVLAHLSHWEPVRIVSYRNDVESRMRVVLRLDAAALRALRETGALPRVDAPAGSGLDGTVVRGALEVSRSPRPPAHGETVVTLKTARVADRTLVVGPGRFGSNVYLWKHGATAVVHRAVVPGVRAPMPSAIVLGPVTMDDVESIVTAGP